MPRFRDTEELRIYLKTWEGELNTWIWWIYETKDEANKRFYHSTALKCVKLLFIELQNVYIDKLDAEEALPSLKTLEDIFSREIFTDDFFKDASNKFDAKSDTTHGAKQD
jgi:hypothetical protein